MAKTTVPTYLSAQPSIIDAGDATAIIIDSSENINIGGQTNHDGAAVLIAHGDSGVTTYSDNADELVIENNANAGISILTPANGTGSIIFGDSNDDDIGKIEYNHSTDDLTFTAADDINLVTGSGNVGITGTMSVSGAITGTLATAAQTNITSVGTLSSLAVGAITSTAASTITTADNLAQLTLESTDADANVGPVLKLFRNSGSPADDDAIGRIQWSADDDAGNDSTFARINVIATDVSNGSEDARMEFAPAVADSFTPTMSLTGGKVGIGTASPETGLHLYGTSNISSSFTIEQVYSGTSKKFGFQPVYNDDRLDIWYNSNATSAITIKDGGNVGIGNTAPLGKLTISNAAGANAPTTVTAANTYLQLGSDDYGASSNGKFMIGFGYTDATNTNSPAYIGFEETSTSGDTKGELTFYTRDVITDSAPTERMRITDGGNVGIGTTGPNCKLHISNAGDADIRLANTSASQELRIDQNSIRTTTNSDINIFTNSNSNQLFLDQGTGNVGIGTSEPDGNLIVAGNGNLAFAIYKSPDGGINAAQQVVVLGSGSSGSNSGDTGGNEHAILQMKHNGTEHIRMFTQGNSWIDTAYNVGIGTTSPSVKLHCNGTSRFANTMIIESAGSIQFEAGHYHTFKRSGNTTILVRADTSATIGTFAESGAYSSSDLRYKENITTITGATEKVKQLRGITHTWKEPMQDSDNPNQVGYGLIAQEVETVIPEVVITDNSEEGYKSINYEKLVPLLIETIKELEARIATLESE